MTAVSVTFLKGPVLAFLWGPVRSECVCGPIEECVCCPGTSVDPRLFSVLGGCLTGGCWFNEVMSELEVKGSGNYNGLCPSSENQALPFLPFSISYVIFGPLLFNQKHTITVTLLEV